MVKDNEKSQVNVNDDEYTYRKQLSRRNKNLARELSKQKLIAQQYLEERNILEKKHFACLVLNLKYESMYTKLMVQAKQALTHCVALSANIGQILELLSQGTNSEKPNEVPLCTNGVSECKKRSGSPSSNKTHAVQPMVSGHVIGRPTINLQRIIDIDFAGYTNSDPGSSSLDSSLSTDDDERPVDNHSGSPPARSEPQMWQVEQDLNVATQMQPIQGLTAELIENQLKLNMNDNREPVVVIQKTDLGKPLATIPEVSESATSINVQEEQVPEPNVSAVPQHSQPKKAYTNSTPASAASYNPLEGPSNLLDNDGFFTGRRVATKRRVHYNEDDYSSDDSGQKKVNIARKKVTTKRKIERYDFGDCVPDETSSRKKTKDSNIRPYKESEKEPMVVLTKLPDNETLSSFIDHETGKNRPRRNKAVGSLKEPNLRGKLRRDNE